PWAQGAAGSRTMKDLMKQTLDEGELPRQVADVRWRQLQARIASPRRARWALAAAVATAAAGAAFVVLWGAHAAAPAPPADAGSAVWVNVAAAPESEAVEISVDAHGGAMSAVPAAV